jgi:hypothetical protein
MRQTLTRPRAFRYRTDPRSLADLPDASPRPDPCTDPQPIANGNEGDVQDWEHLWIDLGGEG